MTETTDIRTPRDSLHSINNACNDQQANEVYNTYFISPFYRLVYM